MAKGRTLSAHSLTEQDIMVLNVCQNLSNLIKELIPDDEKIKFHNSYGKINFSRDAGAGLGGGKLQRDGLCTRGVTSKTPISNRNLRWHPLVIASTPIHFAKPIERIEIEGEGDSQTFVFYVADRLGNIRPYSSDQVWALPERYVILPRHWHEHLESLSLWSDTLWNQNSCVITAYEACNIEDAILTYSILGISISVNMFNVDFDNVFSRVYAFLQSIGVNIEDLPCNKDDIVNCPLCKIPVSNPPANLPRRGRNSRWKPEWSRNKRSEGEDDSIQITHVNPLMENEIIHNVKNVRFGHRWCNISMADHSIDETLDFMEYIVRAHGRI